MQRGAVVADPHAWLKNVLHAAWIPGEPEDEATYLSVLDRALLDRSISATEGHELLATAESAGLARDTVGRLHHDYLRSVAQEALADGLVTDEEHADRVVFTGEMVKGRDAWVSTIAAAGLASGGVTKSTRLLVSADPDSLSGKAAKARSYGIPVVSEEAFERMFRVFGATF